MKNGVLTIGQFNCLVIISMLSLGLAISSELLLHKIIVIDSFLLSAGSFVSPFWFVLSDVITELYGYKASKYMLFCVFLMFFIISTILVSLAHLPSPPNSQGEAAYQLVVGGLLRQFLGSLIAILIASFLNIYLIARWRVLLKGRYFWLRSIASSAIGEILYTSIGFSIILAGSENSIYLGSMIIGGTILKLIGNIILSFPANLAVNYLKKSGLTNIFEDNLIFNPFQQEANPK